MGMLEVIKPESTINCVVQEEFHETRIDSFLSAQFPSYSRTFFKQILPENCVRLNTCVVDKPSTPVKTGDTVTITFPPRKELTYHEIENPERLDAKIIYEHPHFLIVYKPAGLLVHKPSAYHTEVTLVDWLLSSYKEILAVGSSDRPGIVHRLDKYTSGIMVIPRSDVALLAFGSMFKERTITKKYLALVTGHPEQTGVIDLPIGKEKNHRTKMRHDPNGKPSVTHYRVLEYFNNCSLVEVSPITGRTHQIRVHFTAIGHPLVGDVVYGTKSPLIKWQALHAASLSFSLEGKEFNFSHDLPEPFAKAVNQLKQGR